MNIERFVEARKKKGLVQSELAEGICTQATLSRFENNGQVPSTKILIQLCNRLDLPLSELFPKVGFKHSEIIQKMEKAEFSLIVSEYDKAADIIESIKIENIENPELSMRYHYLQAFIMIHKKSSAIDSLYVLDQILLNEITEETEIYRLLAYTGIGIIYEQIAEIDKAEFYFAKVLEQIYDFPVEEVEDIWRVLHILYQCSTFYAGIEEVEISNALAKHAIDICSDNHITYYLARAAIQLAKNAITQNKPADDILELIYDARAYSKINRNKVALAELADMEEYIKNK